jgi:hypothetical protein
MKYLSSRILYSVLLYILLMTLIYTVKPKLIFNNDGTIKNYGIKDKDTIYSLGVISIVLAIISFYLFCLVDLIFN